MSSLAGTRWVFHWSIDDQAVNIGFKFNSDGTVTEGPYPGTYQENGASFSILIPVDDWPLLATAWAGSHDDGAGNGMAHHVPYPNATPDNVSWAFTMTKVPG